MAWFTEEKLTSLKITKDELSKSVVALFEKLDDVKDKDSMVEFATSIKNLKNLKSVDKLFIAAFDPRLAGNVEEYIEELKNFRFLLTTPKAALPLIYLRTYGEKEIESRKDEDGNIPLTEDDIKHLEENEKKFDAALNGSENNDEKKDETKSDDKTQNQNGNETNIDDSAASA